MATSAARRVANQQNAARSTGPRTEAGKARSRENAFKHGLTGNGVVIPKDDLEEVAGITRTLEAELRPSGQLGRILLKRVAVLAVRLDHCFEQEVAARSKRKRDAIRLYDETRIAEVNAALEWIGADPETHARRLEQTPEGVARKIQTWKGIAEDLDHAGPRWGYHHWRLADNLMGKKLEDPPFSRFGALCMILWNQPSYLEPKELDEAAKHAWARQELHVVIQAEIHRLQIVLAQFDRETLARDRAEAPARDQFDPSPEASLARRYEAAAERHLHQAIEDYRQVEAEAEAKSKPPETTKIPQKPQSQPTRAKAGQARRTKRALASFFPEEPRNEATGKDVNMSSESKGEVESRAASEGVVAGVV
jgi:hypothetical protein